MSTIFTDRADVFKYLEKSITTFDLIFADPPYELENIEMIHELVFKNNLLNPDGVLIIEHGQKTDLSSKAHYIETRKYGNVHFSFFTQVSSE
jgi:16S rRNA G966 N2-methylase RsmD